jgi:hypothetical protein
MFARRRIDLVFHGTTFPVQRQNLINACRLFEQDPSRLASPFQIQSSVSEDNFRLFVRRIEGNPIEITADNHSDLTQLAQEMQFDELLQELGEFRPPIAAELHESLEEVILSQGTQIAVLQGELRASRDQTAYSSHFSPRWFDMALSEIIVSYHKTRQVDGLTEKKNQLSVLSDWYECQVLSGLGRMPRV